MPRLAVMPFGSIFMLLSAVVCNAQGPLSEAPSWYLLADFVLASPPINSDLSCGQLDMDPDAIAARIWSNYTVDSCHNVASLFGNNDTCDWRNQQNCPDAVLPSLAENSSPEANYSYASLVYRTPARMEADEMDWSNFTLKVFPEEDCGERDGQSWITWGGCEDRGDAETCSELPYSVASFRLELTAEEELGECVVAAQRGAGGSVRGRDLNLGVLAMGLFGWLILW